MPFDIPTLPDLANRTARAFRANLKGSDAALWPNNVAVSAKVIAGAVWEPFKFLDYIARQIFVLTADARNVERHAAEYGMARLPATYAEGAVDMTGDPGIAVPAGLELQRLDGLRYTIISGGTTDGSGDVTVSVRCQTAGKTGNAITGVGLTLTVPFDRINSVAEVSAAGIGLGADTESTESLRSRVAFRKRNPPHGGAVHDYIAWARAINGVTRVFVDPVTANNGRTNIGLWFLMDDVYVNGIPQLSDVAQVAAYIETVRPAGAVVAVAAPTAQTINITISGLSPDTTAIRNAVIAELGDLFRRAGAVATLTDPVTFYRSKISEAISIATGEDHHTLTVPAGNVAITTGNIPVLGSVTFV